MGHPVIGGPGAKLNGCDEYFDPARIA